MLVVYTTEIFVFVPNFDSWLLEICILATSKVISGWVQTGNCAHSWQLYSAYQAASTIIWYPPQLHYPDPALTSPCPTLLLLSTKLVSEKYKLFVGHWFDLIGTRTPNPLQWRAALCRFVPRVRFQILASAAWPQREVEPVQHSIQIHSLYAISFAFSILVD